jgi:hypothetical protein
MDDDRFPDWRCPTCGLVSSGSSNDPLRGEVARTACRFCQAPKPDLAGWVYVRDGAFWESSAHNSGGG